MRPHSHYQVQRSAALAHGLIQTATRDPIAAPKATSTTPYRSLGTFSRQKNRRLPEVDRVLASLHSVGVPSTDEQRPLPRSRNSLHEADSKTAGQRARAPDATLSGTGIP